MSDLSWEVAMTYIAGAHVEDALRIAKVWNQNGASVILNFLGEHLREESMVLSTLSEYLELIPVMRRTGIRGSVDIKPSQLGLMLGPENFTHNLRQILEVAKYVDLFVWIDMEHFRSVEPTLEVFRNVLDDFGSKQVGICLQANLRRTHNDLSDLVKRGARIRLVKGVYQGNPADMLPRGSQVDYSFRELMRQLFETSPQFVLGTHDPVLIEESLLLNENWNREVEWEMLMGVTLERQMDLLKRKVPFGVYIPYGQDWEPYVRRRLMEARRSKANE